MARLIFNRLGPLELPPQSVFPKEGGYLVICNHLSDKIDPIILQFACPRPIRFMAKRQLFKIPVLGYLMERWFKAFPVSQNSADVDAVKTAIRLLRKGELVGIFPEGGVPDKGTSNKAKRGAAFIAQKAGVPIICCTLTGTDQVWGKSSLFPKRGRMTLEVNRSILPSQDSKTLEREINSHFGLPKSG